MSYGTGPFGTFGFGLPLSPSVADRGTIVSSRSIDPMGTLKQSGDESGSFAGMTDTRQRVLILCALAGREPIKQTSDFESVSRARLRKALLPLTSGTSPVIKIIEIRVEQYATGTKKLVRYRDLTDGEAYEAEV
jgi:hypothetical protein